MRRAPEQVEEDFQAACKESIERVKQLNTELVESAKDFDKNYAKPVFWTTFGSILLAAVFPPSLFVTAGGAATLFLRDSVKDCEMRGTDHMTFAWQKHTRSIALERNLSYDEAEKFFYSTISQRCESPEPQDWGCMTN